MEQIYKSFELLIFVQKFLRKVYLFQLQIIYYGVIEIIPLELFTSRLG